MKAQSKPSRSIGLIVGSLLLASGCGPIAFSDGTALAIGGTGPVEAESSEDERVVVNENEITISEQIQFEYNSARIKSVSYGLLDEVARVIRENPQIKKVRVEGHASSEGNDEYNLQLSKKRARSVMKYLARNGVEGDIISYEGYGEAQPIASNDTAEGRERNRRVEFAILEQQ